MQAYQSPPCPYCGITWNPPGSQACANCRNQLPPPGYAPPGYAPPGYAPPGYPQAGQAPQGQYPGAPAGYPGPQGQGQPYAAYPPAGYPQNQPYGQPQYGQPDPSAAFPEPAPGQVAATGSSLQLFGREIALPFVLPTQLVQYQRPILYGVAGAVVLLVAVLGVLPAVATQQITGAQHALQMTSSHQPTVDAAFAKFFMTGLGSNDPNAEKVVLQQQAKAVADGLAKVQADEAALRSADQQLSWLQWSAPTRGTAIAAERRRLRTALTPLGGVDKALTAGVNEANVALPFLDALIDYTKMGTALSKHDLVGAGALYPDAQQKMETAISLDHADGLPPAIAKQVSSFNDALNGTEALIQALQAKDAAAVKKANDAIQAALKAMNSPAESVPADYESKTFGPTQKAYDSAMKALRA